MFKKLTLAVVVLFLLPYAASADLSLVNYRESIQLPKLKEKVETYVIGVGRGIISANIMLQAQKKERLFCSPMTLAMDSSFVLSLLDQEIRTPSKDAIYNNDTTIEHILLHSFINRFPCSK
jgi:hypothetical protein